MSFCPHRGSKYDDVLRKAGVENEHRPHSPSRVVEYPVRIFVDIARMSCAQSVDNTIYDLVYVPFSLGNGLLGNGAHLLWAEYVLALVTCPQKEGCRDGSYQTCVEFDHIDSCCLGLTTACRNQV